jgi:hypothetical protein
MSSSSQDSSLLRFKETSRELGGCNHNQGTQKGMSYGKDFN